MAAFKRGKQPHHKVHKITHPVRPVQPLRRLEDIHPHRVRHLLYLITFLLIVLIIAVFFTIPLTQDVSQQVVDQQQPQLPQVSLSSVSCTWEEDHYTVCETVSWDKQAMVYAKGAIAGGESLDLSPRQDSSPFTYCQDVGSEDGYRVARAVLYGASGVLRDIGEGILCTKRSAAPLLPVPKQTFSAYTTETGFRVFPERDRSSSTGFFTKTFPNKVQSCTFSGTWRTDTDIISRTRTSCTDGQGSFTGYADDNQQHVVNDPDLYRWAGPSQAALNPPAERHDGYSLWMNTCDAEYYNPGRGPRYGITGTLGGFGTNTLVFTWDYFDANTKPAVDFAFILTCQLKS